MHSFIKKFINHILEKKIERIHHISGHMFYAELTEFIEFADNSDFPSRSELILLEDGNVLNPSHSLHSDISEKGAGKYSHWLGGIYFSSYDNTSPLTNKREYKVIIIKEKLEKNRELELFFKVFLESLVEKDTRQEFFIKLFNESFDNKFFFNDKFLELKEDLLRLLFSHSRDIYGGSIGAITKYKNLEYFLQKAELTFSKKDILEIGPGKSSALGFLALGCGANSYTSIDAFKDSNWNPAYIFSSLLKMGPYCISNFSKEKAFECIEDFKEKSVKFKSEYINEIWKTYEKGEFPIDSESYDCILSISVMEHIYKIESLIQDSYRILRKNGFFIHIIDVSEHKPIEEDKEFQPFEFLKYSDEQWESCWNSENMQFYTNRWRKPDFIRCFEKSGFEVIAVFTEKDSPHFSEDAMPFSEKRSLYLGMDEKMRSQFHPKFQAYTLDDLEPMMVTIIGRKN